MAKKALLILADGFEEMEAAAPMDILRRAGVELTVAGLKDRSVKSARGIVVTAETTLDQAAGDFDALVLPGGGEGARNLGASEAVRARVKGMFQRGKWVCAICASPAEVLAPSGILEGKSVTGYPGMEGAFGKSTKVLKEKVVVDGNVITSAGPATAVEFALTIVEKLSGKKTSSQIRKAILA